MKSKLALLFEAAGLATEVKDWCNLILLHNGARIPPLLPFRGDFVWNWGFNLLIVGGDGTPTHFAKCRASAPGVISATRLRLLLSRDPLCADVVPMTWAAEHGGLHIEISRYLPGRMYDAIVPQLSDNAWRESMRQIVEATDRVSRRVPAALERDGRTQDARFDFSIESTRALSRLEEVGFSKADTAFLASLFEAGGTAERRPQHGDLWSRNIVRFDEHWWLLDFDLFGQVQAPLYDACHLVSTSTDQRASNLRLTRKPWLGRLREGDPLAKPGLDVIRWLALRERLAPAAFVAAFLFYLVDSATRLYGRGTDRGYWEPAMEAVRLALDCERSGPTLIELLSPQVALPTARK